MRKHKGKMYDSMALTCAEYFLADEPKLESRENADKLATQIQEVVNTFMEREKAFLQTGDINAKDD